MRDTGYRTQGEIDQWKARDPLLLYRRLLLESGGVTAEELDAIEAEVSAAVVEAEAFARNSPWPDGATACDHVYAQS
jgi:TPP-dependent pyruvate/acetoin dehydrogenase alpha subunit